MALVAAFAVGLSLLPLPDALRPFPKLTEAPRETLLAAVWPRAVQRPAPVVPPEPELEELYLPPQPEVHEDPDDDAARDWSERVLLSLPAAEQKKARQLEQLAATLGARHLEIEQGCRTEGPGGCEELALDPFFDALSELKAGTRGTPVRVVHLGNSLIASDYITGKARERLQARHGSGGGGFFFVDRPTPNAGLTTRTGRATEGWEIERLTDKTRTQVLGLTGAVFAAGDETLSTTVDVRGAKLADVLYLRQPGGGVIDVRADGRLLAQLSTRERGVATDVLRVALPEGSRAVTVSTRGRVALYGVAVEEPASGVVYDSIGLPGATAEVFLRADEEAFTAQLQARDPAMVVLMLGGNEALERSQGWGSPAKVTAAFEALIDRVRAGAPAAACLLVGPLAAGVRSVSGDVTSRGGTAEVTEAIRAAALGRGCAFWDMFRAFGGDEAFLKWLEKGLMQEDLVHPRLLGGDLLGHLLDFAIARAQLAHEPKGPPPPAALRGQRLSEERLARLFDRLSQLEAGETRRVAMLQLGASHTAAHFFSDQVRRRLAERFGDAGRGFIAAGKASRRLEPSGVRRSLFGPWVIHDAKEKHAHVTDGGVLNNIWALTGVRAEGQPKARVEFTFCARCTETDVTSRLQLFYVEAPDMGVMDVRLEGRTVATLGPPDGGAAPEARVLELTAKGAMQRLEVRNEGPGVMQVLGASAELERPGIVYDALGLPGSTVFTIAGYDGPALTAQLKARGPDLYVLWYGTNESALPNLDTEAMKQAYKQLFGALRTAAPEADCLLITPTDRMSRQKDHTWITARSQEAVMGELDGIAAEHGCAIWSARAAMGGPGSVHTWRNQQPRLAHSDHVHLTPRGYVELANAFMDDFLAAYDRARPAPAPAESLPEEAPSADAESDGGADAVP
jgi:lysophospholipase L1-like esterase